MCAAEKCTLFTPEGRHPELMDAYEMKVDTVFKPNKFPLCKYEDTSSLWISHSTKNPDRPYFRCQNTSAESEEEKEKGCKKKKYTERKRAS